MSLPIGRIEYTVAGSRVHIVVTNLDGLPIACAGAARVWPYADADAAISSVVLCAVGDCDHGGTYREPRSVWTGSRVFDEGRPPARIAVDADGTVIS